jgi:hypothetical protein
MSTVAKQTTKQPTTPAGQPESELVRSLRHQERDQAIAATIAQRDDLLSDLTDARITADAAKQLRSAAEAQWQINEPNHTSAEAPRLEQRQREDTAASRRVNDLANQLVNVEAELRELMRDLERERRMALAAEAWGPSVREVAKAVAELIPALKAQQRTWDQLVEEQAHGYADQDLLLGIWVLGQPGDILLPALEKWIATAECAGLTKDKGK